MRNVVKQMLMGLLLVSAVALNTDDVVAAPEPTSVAAAQLGMPTAVVAIATSSAPAGDTFYCLFCDRYEGEEEHPETMQMVEVVYAYCMEYPNLAGGGTTCDEPLNDWYWDVGDEWIWMGGTCQLARFADTDPFGDEDCDCGFVSHIGWPFDATTIENCWLPTPSLAIAADGFITSVQPAEVTERESRGNETTCTGVISTFAFSARGGKVKAPNSSFVL